MKVTVVGGWSTIRRENKDWGLENRRKLVGACREIGRRLAKRGHTLVVGSDQANSVDPHVVEGYLSEAKRQAKVPPIQVIEGIDGKGELYAKVRRSKKGWSFFLGSPSPFSGMKPRAAEKILAVRDSDALIAIGGLNDTYVAGVAAITAKKHVVPFATFGGASRQLWQVLHMLRGDKVSDDFKRLAGRIWNDQLIDAGFRFGSLDQPRVFLGSSGKARATALVIHEMLQGLELNVVYWDYDFEPGQVILDQLLEASAMCKYAVLLLTPDEAVDGDSARRHPSGNVLFELGFFINALGKGRVRAVVQDGTEILADYGGHIYLRFPSPERVSDIEPALRKLLSEDIPPS